MAHTRITSLAFVLMLSGSDMLAQSQGGGPQVCRSLRSLLKASESDFNSVKINLQRHRDGATDWEPSIQIAGAQDCEGQSYPGIASSVSCTMAKSQSQEEITGLYRALVGQIRSCLGPGFVYAEKQGGKSTRLSTPLNEASFEVKGKGDDSDGPAVRVSMMQVHHATRSGYELDVWVDAKDQE